MEKRLMKKTGGYYRTVLFSVFCSQTLTSPTTTYQVLHHTKPLNNTTVSCI